MSRQERSIYNKNRSKNKGTKMTFYAGSSKTYCYGYRSKIILSVPCLCLAVMGVS